MRPNMGDDFTLLASPASHVGQASPLPRAAYAAEDADAQGAADSTSNLQGALTRKQLLENSPPAWKQLLVNSPPAWAASPDRLYTGYGGSRGRHLSAPAPPFPWPAQNLMTCPDPPQLPPNLRQVPKLDAPGAEAALSFSRDEEQEISIFLSHVSMSPSAYAASTGQDFSTCLPPKTPSPRRKDETLISTGAWTPFTPTDASGQDSGFASFVEPGAEHAVSSKEGASNCNSNSAPFKAWLLGCCQGT